VLQVKVSGPEVPRPIVSFAHAGFDDTLLKEIVKRGFEAPTAIQVGARWVGLLMHTYMYKYVRE
jgi:hypothetical protein